MSAAEKVEHLPSPVASEERAETLAARRVRLTAHQAAAEAAYQAAIRRGDSPPNFDAVLKAAGTTFMEWIQVQDANRLRAELAEERHEADRVLAAATKLRHVTEQLVAEKLAAKKGRAKSANANREKKVAQDAARRARLTPEVLRLKNDRGLSGRAIAKQLDISRETVRKILGGAGS